MKLKIRYIILFITLSVSIFSCAKRDFFRKSKNNQYFINKYQKINYEGEIFYRFSLNDVKKNEILDGYWSFSNNDTLFFIPAKEYEKDCIRKLTFYIKREKNLYYLGHSCDVENHIFTDVIVENSKDTIIDNDRYFKFSHSIIGIDDYIPGIDTKESTRNFLINFDKGLIFLNETGDINELSLYWYNY